ncbi:uncharacterized protein [Arachis hypogaea]|uniref:uncharacterized protein n=1 Tax=Arachis hypogaea TaxID=3818 RepID=UPI003B22783B
MPLSNINSAQYQKFVWREIIAKFGISEIVVTDNGTQFTDLKFWKLLSGLEIRQIFASVEHPQANGQAEAANKVILNRLKKRLDEHLGSWADEVWSVLWSYRTIVQSTTKKYLSNSLMVKKQ